MQRLSTTFLSPYGYTGTKSEIQASLNSLTQAQRVAAVEALSSQLYTYYQAQLSAETVIGQELGAPMSGDDCGNWAQVDSIMFLAAAVMAVIPGGEGAAALTLLMAAGMEVGRNYTCN
jgi:hypothetical protein